MLRFLTELELVVKDFIIFVKKLIRRNKNYDIKRFERRLDRLFRAKHEQNSVIKTIKIFSIKLNKRLLTKDRSLRLFKICLKYLIYFVRYYKRFPIFIFFINIFNKQFYQSYSFNFFRELTDLFIQFLSRYLTEFELKYIQAKVQFYKKRSSYLFFRFFRVLRFKLFFIFFYLFNLFNIIVLRNFITNTPLDANLPIDRGEYHGGNRKFNFFPRIFLTFMESIMVNVRPFQKYLDTFSLMRLNLRGLNGMFYYYIIIDLFKIAKFLFNYVAIVFNFLRTTVVALIRFLIRIFSLREYFDCFSWIFESIFNFYYRIASLFFNFIFRFVRWPFKPLLYIFDSIYSAFNIPFFSYLNAFILIIIKTIASLLFVLVLFLFSLFIVIKFHACFKIFFIYLLIYYYFYYKNLLSDLNRLIENFSLFRYNTSRFFSDFCLSFFYILLNELKFNYNLSHFIYWSLVKKVQKNYHNKELKLGFLDFDYRNFLKKEHILKSLHVLDNNSFIDNNDALLHHYFYFSVGGIFKLYHANRIDFFEMQAFFNLMFNSYTQVCKKNKISLLFNDVVLDYARCDRFLRIRNYKELLLFNKLEILYIVLFFYTNANNTSSMQLKAGLTCFNQKKL